MFAKDVPHHVAKLLENKWVQLKSSGVRTRSSPHQWMVSVRSITSLPSSHPQLGNENACLQGCLKIKHNLYALSAWDHHCAERALEGGSEYYYCCIPLAIKSCYQPAGGISLAFVPRRSASALVCQGHINFRRLQMSLSSPHVKELNINSLLVG